MPRLIWVFGWFTGHFVGFVMLRHDFVLFWFYSLSLLFHSSWAGSIAGWGKTGDPQEKTPDHPQAELGFPQMWPELGLSPQRWDERFRALTISTLNHLATGATAFHFCLSWVLWRSKIISFISSLSGRWGEADYLWGEASRTCLSQIYWKKKSNKLGQPNNLL